MRTETQPTQAATTPAQGRVPPRRQSRREEHLHHEAPPARNRHEKAHAMSSDPTGFKIFSPEETIIDEATRLLADTPDDGQVERGAYGKLAKAYEKLFRTTRKLIRLADRNEEELNKLARTLNDKNARLEVLSSRLSKYLSPQLYRSIFEGELDGELVTQRKRLTVFFSDIKDFTQISEYLQPEDLTWLLNDYFTEMAAIAQDYGATIDKFVGDAMLIFFGDTDSKGVEEDAKACVRMAIAMQRRMHDLRTRWRAKGFAEPFRMRIGINSGYCNVGNFGSKDRLDYTIIGSEVNLASRLENAADPGGILMSYETYALVRDIVAAEARDPIRVKGIRQEVVPYAVLNVMGDDCPDSRIFRHENPGLSMRMDLTRLSEPDRDVARQVLLEALGRLDNE